MRFRAVVALSVLAAIGVMSMACDGFFDYTVVNKTSQELLVWAMTDDCDKTTAHKGDYYHTERIAPGSTINYHETYGGGMDDPKCLQVMTTDRYLVASVDVEPGQPGTLTISDPLALGLFLPEEGDLPSEPLPRQILEVVGNFLRLVIVPLLTLAIALFLLLFVVIGIPTGLVILVSRLRRRLHNRRSGESA